MKPFLRKELAGLCLNERLLENGGVFPHSSLIVHQTRVDTYLYGPNLLLGIRLYFALLVGRIGLVASMENVEIEKTGFVLTVQAWFCAGAPCKVCVRQAITCVCELRL